MKLMKIEGREKYKLISALVAKEARGGSVPGRLTISLN